MIAGRVVQGAAGSTILACGLSLPSVANSGQAQLRAVSLGCRRGCRGSGGSAHGWGAVELAGWQGLFWLDAGIAVACMLVTAATVSESSDPTRSRSIDYAGSVLIAMTLAPIVLAPSKGADWGWFSAATIVCVLIGIVSGFAFVAVERRVAVPMLDLHLLRNRILVGATIAILIGAGTINGLMYRSACTSRIRTPWVLPAPAGLATLPATAGLVAVALRAAPAAKLGGRQVIAVGSPHHHGRIRRGRLRQGGLAVRRIRPAARGDRCRDGHVERPLLVGVDRVRARQPGRLGIRCLQHGPVCGRGRCYRAGRDDLRGGDLRPDRRRPTGLGGAGVRAGGRVVGHGGDQLSSASSWLSSWAGTAVQAAPSMTPRPQRRPTPTRCRRPPRRPRSTCSECAVSAAAADT